MIELSAVRLRFADFEFGPMDLRVEQGAYVAVLGPSAAGKSTLLDVIAGFVRPETGVVSLRGDDVAQLAPHDRGLGWVSQQDTLFPHLSVAENIRYGLACRGVGAGEQAERAEQCAALVHLDKQVLQRRVTSLSGGERQRVALARALAPKPDLLLLDEPFTSLDAGHRAKLHLLMRELHAAGGLTVVHVTHDLSEARTLADSAYVVLDGKVAQQGSVDDIAAAPATHAVADAFALPMPSAP